MKLIPFLRRLAGDRRAHGLAVLILVALLSHVRAVGHDFVDFDDGDYVYRNEHVQQGLSWDSIRWAATTLEEGNWHPVMWWSYLLDTQLWGTGPTGFHVTNLLLHLVTVGLLFGALVSMGVDDVFAFGVAALWAVHPLHVESVAWVSERKGLLSNLFWMAGMLAYSGSVRRRSWLSMGAVFACFVLGLMSKPNAVVFPLGLLLLDIWPLQRVPVLGVPRNGEPAVTDRHGEHNLENEGHSKPLLLRSVLACIVEKLHLFAMSGLFAVVAYIAQDSAGAVPTLKEVGAWERISRVPCAYMLYIAKFVWPVDLHLPDLVPASGFSLELSALCLVGVVALTVLFYMARRFSAAYFVGWTWFLVTMLPTSGLVPVGIQWMADRYMDIPSLGVCLIVVAALQALVLAIPAFRKTCCTVFLVIVGLLGVRSTIQHGAWTDTKALWSNAIECDPENRFAYDGLAKYYVDHGQPKAAYPYLDRARELFYDQSGGNKQESEMLWLALTLEHAVERLGQGEVASAVTLFQKVLEADASCPDAYYYLGRIAQAKDPHAAERYFRLALQYDPGFAPAHAGLGTLLSRTSPQQAIGHLQRSLQLWPQNADAHCNLGNVLVRAGKVEEALRHYAAALQVDPNHVAAQRNLAVVRQMVRGADSPKDSE